MRSNAKILLITLAVCALVAGFLSRQPQSRVDLPEPKYTVVLRSFQELQPARLEGVADYIELHTGRRPRIGQPLTNFSESAFNPERNQWKTGALLQSVQPEPNEVVLVLTSSDIYTESRPEWRYCFGEQSTRRGMLSSYRMGLEAQPAAQQRLKKMTLRYVLELAYGMKRSNMKTSILRTNILGPADIDQMKPEL